MIIRLSTWFVTSLAMTSLMTSRAVALSEDIKRQIERSKRESFVCCPSFYIIFKKRIIIGSDRRPETKQGIEGKIVRLKSGRVRDRVKDRVRVGVLGIRIADLNLHVTPCVKKSL